MVIQDRCVICDIVAGKISAWIVDRDADLICFLPKTLEAYGHTLIAPKEHYSDIFSIPEHLLEIAIATTKKLAIYYRDRIGSSGINLLHASGKAAQQSVFHLHFHLIPRFDGDGLDTWPKISSAQYNKDEILEKLRLPHASAIATLDNRDS
jgi:histidine triad (HIT) family protein